MAVRIPELARYPFTGLPELFQTDKTCLQEIGLSVILDVPALDRPTPETMIDRFYGMGETDWRAPDPVPSARFDRLDRQERSRPGDADPAP